MDKRRASTRITKGEPPFKRRHTTPTPQSERKPRKFSKLTKVAKPTTPLQEEEEPLPLKIVEGRPLPTRPNDGNALEGPLQSVVQSGVLAAALKRSRNKWAVEGMFEKYWTKPSKRKGQEEPQGNPPKESMRPLGPCRVIVEPHIFHATLFHVLDIPPAPAPAPPAPATVPGLSSVTSKSPVNESAPTSTAPALVQSPAPRPSSQQSQKIEQPPQQEQQLPKPQGQQQSPPAIKAEPASAPAASSASPAPVPAPVSGKTGQTQGTATHAAASPTPQTLPAVIRPPGQDPVIQMLAQRATTSPELKELMKVVASGGASEAQLRVFQSHINELNGIVQRQAADATRLTAPPGNGIRQQNTAVPYKTGTQSFQPQRVGQPMGNVYHQSFTTPYTPPALGKPRPMKNTVRIAIEFAEGSGDRFLFPKHCILELLPRTSHIIASFLVTRKGDVKDGGKYGSTVDVYQPITIRLVPEGGTRVYETLSRVTAPYAESRRYMEDAMTRMERVHDTQLVIQLPSETGAHDEAGKHPLAGSDRLQNLKAAARVSPASPAPETKQTRAAKQKQESWDQLCKFCFETLPAAQASNSGSRACQACLSLVRASGKPGLPLWNSLRANNFGDTHVSGPQTLVF